MKQAISPFFIFPRCLYLVCSDFSFTNQHLMGWSHATLPKTFFWWLVVLDQHIKWLLMQLDVSPLVTNLELGMSGHQIEENRPPTILQNQLSGSLLDERSMFASLGSSPLYYFAGLVYIGSFSDTTMLLAPSFVDNLYIYMGMTIHSTGRGFSSNSKIRKKCQKAKNSYFETFYYKRCFNIFFDRILNDV